MSDKLDVAKVSPLCDEWRRNMDDIKHRLRYAQIVEPTMPSRGWPTSLGDEAANRIEELERELESKRNPK